MKNTRLSTKHETLTTTYNSSKITIKRLSLVFYLEISLLRKIKSHFYYVVNPEKQTQLRNLEHDVHVMVALNTE